MKKFLFPHFCLLCRQENFLLCPECQKTILLNFSGACPLCQNKNYAFQICPACQKKNCYDLAGIFSATFWQDPLVKKLVYHFKYDFVFEAGKILENILVDFVKKYALFSNPGKICLVPVPLHPDRLLWRGFNQSELLAAGLHKEFGVSLIKDLVWRQKHALPQMEIEDAVSRKHNVYAAFSLNQKYEKDFLKDKTVFIVDDISTTGATLNECARVLKKLKPEKIYGLVIAQA